MFLPNTDSFVLIQKKIVKTNSPVFLPSTDSFVLVRKSMSSPILTFESENFESENVVTVIPQSVDPEQPKVNDHSKRNFLKVASVAGVGVAAATLLPNKAHALVMGSSPTTGVVGVKNSTNTRINPATEETVSTLATEATAATLLKTSDLSFDAGSLQVTITGAGASSFSDSGNVAKSGLVDGDRHVQVDVLSSTLPTSASTETTLQTISFGGFKFTLRLATVGEVDYVGEASIGSATSAASWRIKKVDNTSGIIIQWAGTGVFDQVWDNRVSLTYS